MNNLTVHLEALGGPGGKRGQLASHPLILFTSDTYLVRKKNSIPITQDFRIKNRKFK